jgi:hypothetical protein
MPAQMAGVSRLWLSSPAKKKRREEEEAPAHPFLLPLATLE